MPDTGGRATKVGEKVVELQRLLPNARVVYCSATGAPLPPCISGAVSSCWLQVPRSCS